MSQVQSGKQSYPPAENIGKMIKGLCSMRDIPFPMVFRSIRGNPKNWAPELEHIYKTERRLFEAIRNTLPHLSYDELGFLRRHLGLIEERDLALKDFEEKLKSGIEDTAIHQDFMHVIMRIIPLHSPLRCFVPSIEGTELSSYYLEDRPPDYCHFLFLKFLCIEPPFFAEVLQDDLTRNLGTPMKLTRINDVRKRFDAKIKPRFTGRDESSTESKNISQWLEYFKLLKTYNGIFVFDSRQFKALLVGAVCRFLNQRLAEEGHLVSWEGICRELTERLHLNADVVDLEELIELIISVNATSVRWIPSERGESGFRGQRSNQILEYYETGENTKLSIPRPQIVEGSDFLRTPSIPKIEGVDLIKASKLE